MADMKVVVEKLVAGGYSLAHLPNNKVVLLDGGYPDEFVEIQIDREKKDLAFGRVTKVLTPSQKRRKPHCKHFGECGGCRWQDIEYLYQLDMKREILREQFFRIARMDVEVEKVEASPNEFEYRNIAEFTFQMRKLGFKRWHSSSVVDIKRCWICPKTFSDIARRMKEIVEILNLPIYNWKSGAGVLKHLVIRQNSRGDLMIIVVTKTEHLPNSREITRLMTRYFPAASIVHLMNAKDSIVLRGPYRILKGEGVITEETDWYTFQIPPTAFFQVNLPVALKMAEYVYEEIHPDKNAVLIDMYTGVGFLAINSSHGFKKVLGVDSNRVAIKAAISNANINRIRNVEFVNQDVEDFVTNMPECDRVILDPPRQGISERVLKKIVDRKPKRVLYVACDTASLARDVRKFVDAGYKLEKLAIFDMFPQTHHIEAVATLTM